MRRLALVLLAASYAHGASVEVLRVSFEDESASPYAVLVGEATVADGTLRCAAAAKWKRAGLEVGPLSLGPLEIGYDFRPVRLGRQGQEFTSQAPGTHWYMLYATAQGHLHLHTRHQSKWALRGRSEQRVRVGVWYRGTVWLTATTVRARVAERESGAVLWDTGEVAVDDLGETTTFLLTNESPVAGEGETEWDNVVLSTSDERFAARLLAAMREAAEGRERRALAAAKATEAAREIARRGLSLIPVPQQVRFRPGTCDLGACAISFPKELHATAAAVQTILHEQTGRKLSLAPGGKAGLVLETVQKGPWPQATTRPTEGYRLVVRPSGVTVTAQSPAGFLCAAQTLSQLARGGSEPPCVEIVDWPAIENRLVMIAVSQGAFQVIDMDYWRRIIRELAAVKINMIMPYFEGGTYYYEKHPFLGVKGRDGFTGDKARALSAYAQARGVELVPQQEALGHSGNVLTHREIAHLRESGGVFCSSKPEVFAFLDSLFEELTTAFPYTRYLHVGGDEFTHGFGKCSQCKGRIERIGPAGLYAEHMMRLRSMLAQRDRRMMIWWHERGFTEQAADRLAKDIVVFDWHYGNQRSYPTLARLQKLGFTNVWATPAVTRYYRRNANDFADTFGNIRGFLTEGAERGVPGQCTCTWVHGIWGGRNLFELNYYALVYSGQCAWKPANADEEDFRGRFAQHWFGLTGERAAQEVLHAWHAPFGERKEQGFWRDCRGLEPRLAQPPAATVAEVAKNPELVKEAERLLAFCDRANRVLDRWRAAGTRNAVTIDFLAHDVHVHETLARRILTMDQLRLVYPKARAAAGPEGQALLAPVVERLKRLVGRYEQMERMFGRSVREAGGGPCGHGGWFPFVAKGGIQFRAALGREGVEQLIARIEALHPPWPAQLW